MRRTEKKLGYFQNHQNWTAEILLYANLFDLKTSIFGTLRMRGSLQKNLFVGQKKLCNNAGRGKNQFSR